MMDRISTKVVVLIFICVQVLSTHIAQGHRPIRVKIPYFRGGESRINQEEDWVNVNHTPTLTVAILGRGAKVDTPSEKTSWLDDVSSPSCILVATNTESNTVAPIGSIDIQLPKTLLADEIKETDAAIVETLCFLSDVVVIMLPKKIDGSDPMWTGIVQGANRRKASSLQKGRLLLVSSGKMELEQNEEQKSLFESVDTIRTDDLPTALEEYLAKTDATVGTTISTLFGPNDDADTTSAFLGVLNQVYKSVSGAPTEGEFHFSTIPAVSAVSETPETPTIPELSEIPESPPEIPAMGVGTTKTESAEASMIDAASEHDSVVSILAKAQSKLASLERKVEEAMLAVAEDSTDNQNSSGMPLLFLDFGNLASEVLEEAYSAMKEHLSQDDNSSAAIRWNVIVTKIVGELLRLYREQVQLVRDYYGRRYETMLEQLAQELEEAKGKLTRQESDQKAGVAAEQMVNSFQAACQHSIPKLCRSDGELAVEYGANFDFTKDLSGLMNDMMEATTMRAAVEDDDDEGAMEDIAVNLSRWGRFKASIPNWAKKLAARGIMLGVNYAQGWLAWQGLKRAAAERDRKMPKFPLF